jgi:hypothetical protein
MEERRLSIARDPSRKTTLEREKEDSKTSDQTNPNNSGEDSSKSLHNRRMKGFQLSLKMSKIPTNDNSGGESNKDSPAKSSFHSERKCSFQPDFIDIDSAQSEAKTNTINSQTVRCEFGIDINI